MPMTHAPPHDPVDQARSLRGLAHYLAIDGGEPIFAALHAPIGPNRSNTGVIICAPFGWEELCAHRGMRALAGALAHAGHTALRFDLPGTGDSGGLPSDPGLLGLWTAAADAAAASLRAGSACERIVAFGVGLGGLVACRAVALGAAIDDLVLWSVPPRGRMLVREMRTFARMSDWDARAGADDSRAALTPAAAVDDRGELNVAGFLLTEATLAELDELDLAELPIPDASRRRVLLFGRDTLSPDKRLRELYEQSGVALTVSNGPGYGAMMVDPALAQVPWELFARTLAWLGEPPPAAPPAWAGTRRSTGPALDDLELKVGTEVIRETQFAIDYEGQQLSGILTEPVSAVEADLCVVLLNAGAVRRIGPQRMWVEAARRWAALGVPTLRFDAAGIGDSDGDDQGFARRGIFHRRAFSGQVVAAFDELERRGLPGRFLVGGMCSGAYWGLHAALGDRRVRGLLLMNLLAFVWSPELGAARDARRARALLHDRNLGTVIRIVATDRWRMARMLRAKLSRSGSTHGASRFTDQTAATLDALREGDVETLLLLSLEEPLMDDLIADGLLDRLAQWPNLQLERIAARDHVFRALWSQRQVHTAMDGALARTLGRKS
jgi:pimeloyl-ACP methyl ester carboxylesterase